MNPCATFPPPIMYTNEYREKKIRNDVATIFFFFSLKNKIKYSSKIRRYRNFSEFSLEKYISNDIKKRKRKGKNIDDAEEEKHFYSSKIRNASSTFTIHHPFSKYLPPPRNTATDIASYLSLFQRLDKKYWGEIRNR